MTNTNFVALFPQHTKSGASALTTQEQLLRNGHAVCSRLVSGWVRKDNTNE